MSIFKSIAVCAVVGLWMALAPAPVHAQDRSGVIEDLQPIENRGDDESEVVTRRRALGARLGQVGGLGAAMGLRSSGATSNPVGGAAMAAAGHGDVIGSEVAARMGDQGPTTRYMVKVRLDTGRVLTITQLREQIEGLEIGDPVRVRGRGDSALVFAAD